MQRQRSAIDHRLVSLHRRVIFFGDFCHHAWAGMTKAQRHAIGNEIFDLHRYLAQDFVIARHGQFHLPMTGG